MDDKIIKPCLGCGKLNGKMFKCKTCREVYKVGSFYCSVECQKTDWRTHKVFHSTLIDPATSRPAFTLTHGYRFYLRTATESIPRNTELTDQNTAPYTEALIKNFKLPGMQVRGDPSLTQYGPFPAGEYEASGLEGIFFSNDLRDRNITHLRAWLNSQSQVIIKLQPINAFISV
jgi:hypothetical protein